MCSDLDKHRIELVNLNDNELINYPFLLIKGFIKRQAIDTDLNSNIKLFLDDCYLTPDDCLITNVSPINGQFKCLLNLHSNNINTINAERILRFEYASAKTCVTIRYLPKNTPFKVQPLLILAKDEPDLNTKDYQIERNLKVIQLNLLLVQSVFAEKLREAGKGRCTFTLMPECEILRMQLTREQIWQMNQDELWQAVSKELSLKDENYNKLISNYLKYVGFINCSYYEIQKDNENKEILSYENIRRRLKGHAALGGDNLALFSCVFFYCWPNDFSEIYGCFENSLKVDFKKYPDDSNYRHTWGGTYASTLGSVCHEIGHIFDLGHSDDGIMGSGLDYINRVFLLNHNTENLPRRSLEILNKGKNKNLRGTLTQCTNIKSAANNFLENYRQQKLNDAFYFNENCSIILSYHPWLTTNTSLPKATTNNNNSLFPAKITLKENHSPELNVNVVNVCSSVSIKLIEVRAFTTNKVIKWFEFQHRNNSQSNIYEFCLPPEIGNKIKAATHYLFVLTTTGQTKLLNCLA